MVQLNDEDCVQAIRDYVRSNADIEVYDYIRRGCNGEVYFGKRKKMGDDVVLKFYWSHPNYDATEECAILQKIKHDNILEVKECRFVPPNYAFFLTPKISGGDLQGIIDSRAVSTKEALGIISGILLGLTELHSKHSLVHRDLKPGNILIDSDTANVPIIADLGAIKKVDEANGFVTASKSTYLYLPPESIAKDEYYFQSDIYQIGIIFYQLLNGFFPINDPMKWMTKKEEKELNTIRNSMERERRFDDLIAKKIVKGTLVISSALPNYLDNSFKRIINIATHLKHGSRYKNPSFFLKDIHKTLREAPDYKFENNLLTIDHDSGKKYKVYQNAKNDYMIEKSISNNHWTKQHSHNGKFESVLALARKS